MLALLAAACFLLGVFVPYLSGGGDGNALSDGSSEIHMILTGPAVLALVLALVGLNGSRLAAGVSAGITVGIAGLAAFILGFVQELLSSIGDYDGAPSQGAGFVLHAVAVVLALVSLFSLRGTAPPEPGERAVQPALAVLGGMCFAGMPLAMLLPEHGHSVLEFAEGLMKVGILAWAFLGPVAGLLCALTKKRALVAVSLGVSIANLGVVLGIAESNSRSGTGFFSGVSISNEGLFNITVVASVLLLAAALAAGGPAPAVVSPAAAAPGSPGQWAADPYGRHELRYWDGGQWTAAVSDSGVVGSDAPVAAAPPQPVAPAVPEPPAAAPASPFAPPVTPAPSEGTSMKVCPQGHLNDASASFCTRCGSPLNG